MRNNYLKYAFIVGLLFVLNGCGGGGDSSSGQGNISSDYPRLISTPQITYVRNIYDATKYDVTVTLNADGPSGVYSVSLWLQSASDPAEFTSLDLQSIGGNSWSATTNIFLPLPAGNYYLDDIMIEDGDPFLNGVVKSSWYVTGLSSTHYTVDQRQTDWSTVTILNYNLALAGSPIVRFTLP